MGLSVPAAKGAMVKGISAADMALRRLSARAVMCVKTMCASQRPNDSCHEWVMARAQGLGHSLNIKVSRW